MSRRDYRSRCHDDAGVATVPAVQYCSRATVVESSSSRTAVVASGSCILSASIASQLQPLNRNFLFMNLPNYIWLYYCDLYYLYSLPPDKYFPCLLSLQQTISVRGSSHLQADADSAISRGYGFVLDFKEWGW